MAHLEYATAPRLLEHEELGPSMNQMSVDGWRLHTCEPVVTGWEVRYLVVMDRLVEDEQDQGGSDESATPIGMAMRG